MIRTIIFDFDDTLISTLHGSYERHMAVGAKLGLKAVSRRKFTDEWGPPWQKLLPTLWKEVSYEAFKKLYISMWENKTKYREIPGALKTLEKLTFEGYHLYLLTSRDKTTLVRIMRYLKMEQHFIHIHALEHGRYFKPDPRVFTVFLKQNKLKKEQCMYVGDLIIDFQAASRAGLNYVAVTSGATSRAKFLRKGVKAKNIISSVKELPKWLEKNNE